MNMNKLSTSLFMQGSHGCIHAESAHIVFFIVYGLIGFKPLF